MEFSTEGLERAICQFYQSNSSIQSEAHDWLKKAKVSPEAWHFVWELLQPQRSCEVQFFAASTLQTKIKRSLNELSPENILALKEMLISSIIAYSTGPKIVLNKLCVSLSVYLLQVCPEKWPDAIPTLLMAFTPENFPQVSPERILWMLLEIFIVIPEELSRVHLHQHQKGLLRHHLTEHTPLVIALFEKILSSHTDQEIILQTVKCVSSWITIGVSLSQYQNLFNLLVNLVFTTHKHPSDICEKVLECLKVIMDQPENYKFPTYLLEILTKFLPFKEIIDKELSLGESADQDLICNIYTLFITFGEANARQCLYWIEEGGEARKKVLALATAILHCSGARGYYPVDETCSRLSFGFWYILQDEIIMSAPKEQKLYMEFLGPLYKELVSLLIKKAQLPDAEKNFTEEDFETFRCYRQDISDTLMYCHSLLHETTIKIIQSKLEKININETKWQELEACLFSLSSISENIELEENNFLPSLFQYIKNLPFQRLNPKVFSTALDTIGAYADWISAHTSMLEHVLPLVILGLNVPEATSSATMALKDIARDCQNDMKPYMSLILDASQEALHGGRLKLNDSQRLMSTVGTLLSVLPLDVIMHYLNLILTPYLEQLDSLAVLQPSPEVKNNILVCLKMVGVLSASLNTKLESVFEDGAVESQSRNNEPQPVLLILHKLIPALRLIANSWSADDHIMLSWFTVIKHCIATLHEDAHSVVIEILNLIVSTYRVHPQPAALDLSKLICQLFGDDEKCQPLLQSLVNELCTVTMANLSTAHSLSDHTELLEYLFSFYGNLVRKNSKLVTCIDFVPLFQCATVTLAIPDLSTVKAASSFLVYFITHSAEVNDFKNVVNTYGQQLVFQIVSCIAGEVSRYNVEPLAQIIFAINKYYLENHSRWLRQAVTENTCPRATPQQRENFISAVMVQKNKANLQENVKKFSLICRGILGTDYA